MTYIPYLSTLVTFAFTVAVYNRYRQRGGTHLFRQHPDNGGVDLFLVGFAIRAFVLRRVGVHSGVIHGELAAFGREFANDFLRRGNGTMPETRGGGDDQHPLGRIRRVNVKPAAQQQPGTEPDKFFRNCHESEQPNFRNFYMVTSAAE